MPLTAPTRRFYRGGRRRSRRGVSPTAAAGLALADTTLGRVLTDQATGKTLYVFAKDTSGTSTCYNDCASTWPLLSHERNALGGRRARPGESGHHHQNRWHRPGDLQQAPLCFFAADSTAGEVPRD
ncbi:hypothetical protein OHA77_15010 [Streptosporangium sp. NBC_01639]|uniref:hypothetical protein n=1 Tax=Streptosporangium sp. NBC_01639 TaxID=2975948 RepID=UPI003870DD58|nr:hypothetical protein OHA77_15010 [Streptosporangium sp. NBC_01639]